MSSEKMPRKTKKKRGVFFVICGPSGAGKTTLLNHLRRRFSDLVYVPSYTSRPPRSSNEIKSGRYRFIAKAEFERLVQAGEFLEHAVYAGNYYGTARREVKAHLTAGRDVIKESDVQGIRQLRARRGRLVAIFVLPPSLEELEKRLAGRGTEDHQAQRQRLAAVLSELGVLDVFDYIVINRNVTESVERLSAIIQAERSFR